MIIDSSHIMTDASGERWLKPEVAESDMSVYKVLEERNGRYLTAYMEEEVYFKDGKATMAVDDSEFNGIWDDMVGTKGKGAIHSFMCLDDAVEVVNDLNNKVGGLGGEYRVFHAIVPRSSLILRGEEVFGWKTICSNRLEILSEVVH